MHTGRSQVDFAGLGFLSVLAALLDYELTSELLPNSMKDDTAEKLRVCRRRIRES